MKEFIAPKEDTDMPSVPEFINSNSDDKTTIGDAKKLLFAAHESIISGLRDILRSYDRDSLFKEGLTRKECDKLLRSLRNQVTKVDQIKNRTLSKVKYCDDSEADLQKTYLIMEAVTKLANLAKDEIPALVEKYVSADYIKDHF